MRPHQQRKHAGYDLLRRLGWGRATLETALVLPLGSNEERRTVRAFLESGDGQEWLPENAEAGPEGPDVEVLPVYAARVGVATERVAQLLDFTSWAGHRHWAACAEVIAQRGADAERDFLGSFWGPFNRNGAWTESRWGPQVVQWVHRHGLPLPDSAEYAMDIWVQAARHLIGPMPPPPLETDERWLPRTVSEAVVRERFAGHVELTAALGAAATGPVGECIRAALAAGWISREELLPLAMQGLHTAHRPGDRKAWATVLEAAVAVTPGEAAEASAVLIPVLSFGEPAVGVPLLVGVPDAELAEVVLALSTATTAGARRAVLRTLDSREAPDAAIAAETLEALASWGQREGPVRAALLRLREGWLGAGTPESSALDARERAVFAWSEVPPVRDVPRVSWPRRDDEEAELLAAGLAVLRRPWERENAVDLDVERFLFLAHRLARRDPQKVRAALGALDPAASEVRPPAVTAAIRWAERGAGVKDRRRDDVAQRRTRHVAQRLGEWPILLSSPSWEDLRIDAAELTERLEALAETGGAALESDLLLALMRLDLRTMNAALGRRLSAIDVPVQTWETVPLEGANAGAIVLRYADDPVIEPRVSPGAGAQPWTWEIPRRPESLDFTRIAPRWKQGRASAETAATHPTWGDALGPNASASWEQICARGEPLGPGLAMNLLGELRWLDAEDTAHHRDLLVSAFSRGILLPGVADLAFLDWTGERQRWARLAQSLVDTCHDGLLPVVWPLLDQMCAVSSAGPMPPGSVAVVEAMEELLPSVQAAVREGTADARALSLPGLRSLAARTGASRTVALAKVLARATAVVRGD